MKNMKPLMLKLTPVGVADTCEGLISQNTCVVYQNIHTSKICKSCLDDLLSFYH